ncbi:LrgB family protein [Paraburkholderia pallida]|uniref:LrgB family protein n=1 Tax=Paraburkholderia pallida TaxID=2547399 RepID=A0A4P7CZF5_9BURK|nr:LrgB family protein [Paraburkholderia pallida]QBQ99463.1 LrgB family protein [Paraburkholderia pallida]
MSVQDMPGIATAFISSSPVPALTATLGVYLVACRLHALARRNPLANPVAISVVLLIGLLRLTGTPYSTYFNGARFVHFLLGPAIVALAVPLYRQMPKLRGALVPLLAGLVAGSVTAVVSAVTIAMMLGLPARTVASIAPKSVTAAIAMLISATIGGVPPLTAAMVIATGILGAVLGSFVLGSLGVRRDDVCGFALGIAAHGIGTARALQISEEAGAFAGLGMAVNGILSAFVLPLVFPIVMAWVST